MWVPRARFLDLGSEATDTGAPSFGQNYRTKGGRIKSLRMETQTQTPTQYKPFSLIAEITHRCPLHCLYCSNPLEMQRAEEELSTEDWKRVFLQAAQLGILHLHLTGGEPLARKDLPELIQAARAAGLYVNMITSGVGLSEDGLATLVDAGLEHLQLSFQDIDEVSANHSAGTRSHALKLALI